MNYSNANEGLWIQVSCEGDKAESYIYTHEGMIFVLIIQRQQRSTSNDFKWILMYLNNSGWNERPLEHLLYVGALKNNVVQSGKFCPLSLDSISQQFWIFDVA